MTNSVAIGVAYQDQAISGGAVDNTPIGATTPSTVVATTATAKTLIVSSAAAFFSVTAAVAQPSGAAQAAVTTEAATTGAATYGLTSAQMNTMVATVNAIRTALVALGLIKGS